MGQSLPFLRTRSQQSSHTGSGLLAKTRSRSQIHRNRGVCLALMKITAKGMTVMEMLLVVFILGFLMLGLAHYKEKIIIFAKRFEVRRQMTTDARNTLETIVRLLRVANPNTVLIDTPPAAGAPPNSRIQFRNTSNVAQEIYWSDDPYGTVFFRTAAGTPRKLGDSVTSLIFTADFRDLSLITVSLRMDASYDASGREDQQTTLALANQTVRLGETP